MKYIQVGTTNEFGKKLNIIIEKINYESHDWMLYENVVSFGLEEKL